MTQVDDVQASYGRCLRDRKFISRFYELLLEKDSRIRAMFEGTNWNQQQRMLRRGISISLTYASGSNAVRRSMDEMAEVHSRTGRCPVPPAYYQHWCDALVQAVSEFEPRMKPGLEESWRQALKPTTEHFADQY